ncbi:SxtJ family membrane protein [Mucilaginibacter sabulilitoris]|uniref:SxtJ family membrane protein n=1 Tax=Mucilaginibacter sabulilitoris TaxID=1173583 RepID=A0ABZ0TEI6_9SPHI|nr:SxtJ family membrane protein [Mucilaginibacter sabulilitoris]WPU91605.1 SxtJ family membrane protein [Mucilaginibacter sabulilitoris]
MIADKRPANKDNRKFGLTLGAVLAAIALYQHTKALPAWPYFAGFALLFISLSLMKPSWLLMPRIIWEKLAHYLGYMNTLIWLTLIYILFFTPVNLILKMTGRDPLNRKYQPRQKSYWLTDDKQAVSSSLKKQF